MAWCILLRLPLFSPVKKTEAARISPPDCHLSPGSLLKSSGPGSYARQPFGCTQRKRGRCRFLSPLEVSDGRGGYSLAPGPHPWGVLGREGR